MTRPRPSMRREEEPVVAEYEDSAEEPEAVGGDAYLPTMSMSMKHAEPDYYAREQDAFSPTENPTPPVLSDAAAAIAAQFQTLAASMVISLIPDFCMIMRARCCVRC